MRVETEMSNPETMALIQSVIDDFDPKNPMDEDEAMFSARFQDFERSNLSGADQSRRRQAATKKVSETYHLKRAKREKEAEIKRLEQEMKQKQTDELNAQFARLIEESKQLKE